ncbi:MAG: PEGA domain-containing protein [candidate division Zixibacteria bacterium]|nr:PEGA domain-containing protein [candidate division Zixibacteria bacterium]
MKGLGKNALELGVKVFATLILMLAAVYGCATIMHGTSQDIGITSRPTGAQVTVDNKDFGKTPVVAGLSRKDHHIVKIELEGYEIFETTITRSTSGWVWGNIIFGGLIGLAVDAITGGLYKLNPEQVEGALATKAKTDIGTDDKLYIAVVLKPDPSWEKIGNLRVTESK